MDDISRGNIANDLSFVGSNRERFKDELIRFYAKQGFTRVLNLFWNADAGDPRAAHTKQKIKGRNVSIERARQDIGALLARIDGKLLHRNFHEEPKEKRTKAVFFIEHVGSNLHAHGLIRVQRDQLLKLHRLFPSERGGPWNRLVPSGSYRLEMIDDVVTTVGYLVKEQHLGADDRMIVWADEFFA